MDLDYLDLSEEVKTAKKNNKPIVALETTIISHGMPYPENLQTATEVENIIREAQAVPATIGIINGRIKIGMNKEELEFFSKEKEILKLSRKDLPIAISGNKSGATTVAGTMFLADLAGIRVFVTGGIGGVHRDAAETFDISQDLIELSKTSVAVICAGAKSILDLPKTLEFLETFGVPVIGYKTDYFPAFFSSKSHERLELRMDNEEEISKFIKTKWEMGLNGGVVIANPVPQQDEFDFSKMEEFTCMALDLARKNNINGKALTPFLLNKIKELTAGKSLQTNISLIKNNAFLGAKLAISFLDKL